MAMPWSKLPLLETRWFSQSLFFLPLYWVITFACYFSSTQANRFYVGGKDGWMLPPPESYDSWAGRNRFLVHDTLNFRYENEADSMLLVNRNYYDKSNTANPIQKWDDGNTILALSSSLEGKMGTVKWARSLRLLFWHWRLPPPPPALTSSPPSFKPGRSPSGSPGSLVPGQTTGVTS